MRRTFTEIETGKGVNALEKRPELRAALDMCRKEGATLLIAKLDRLAPNCAFVSGLLETGCEFVAVDMPHANKTMIQIYAAMSEWEREQISGRTKAALAAAKARGVQLGVRGRDNLAATNEGRKKKADAFAERLWEQIVGYQRLGYSQRKMVDGLNRLGVMAPRGGRWSLKQVQLLARLHALVQRDPVATSLR